MVAPPIKPPITEITVVITPNISDNTKRATSPIAVPKRTPKNPWPTPPIAMNPISERIANTIALGMAAISPARLPRSMP